VYNRFASGETVFSAPEEAKVFVDLFRWVKKRDGWTVVAWCLMSNHYHLAIRSRAVPISHGLHYLQGRFSQRYNRDRGRTGALWQSRYQAKLIDEGAYLGRVILYIHLNPVVAGVVTDPADYPWSGHRELAKRLRNPLIDPDEALLSFGETERSARRSYLSSIRVGCAEAGRTVMSPDMRERIWLRGDRDLAPDESAPYIDVLGRSTGLDRPDVSAVDFVEHCVKSLNADLDEIVGPSRRRDATYNRQLIVSLGRERWGQQTKELAIVINRSPDRVSHIAGEGTRRRVDDEVFSSLVDRLDTELFQRFQRGSVSDPSDQ
jgi:REP element-mobilizing transposase RayT